MSTIVQRSGNASAIAASSQEPGGTLRGSPLSFFFGFGNDGTSEAVGGKFLGVNWRAIQAARGAAYFEARSRQGARRASREADVPALHTAFQYFLPASISWSVSPGSCELIDIWSGNILTQSWEL